MFKPDVFLKKVSVTHFQSKKKVQLLTLEERNIPAFFFFFFMTQFHMLDFQVHIF